MRGHRHVGVGSGGEGEGEGVGLCARCPAPGALCCRYVTVGIDGPSDRDTFDRLLWIVSHPGVSLLVQWDGGWCVQFTSNCTYLRAGGLCAIYPFKPKVCTNYEPGPCDGLSPTPVVRRQFRTPDEFMLYMEDVNGGGGWRREGFGSLKGKPGRGRLFRPRRRRSRRGGKTKP